MSASDPKSVAAAKRKAHDADTQRIDELRALLKLPAFRNYVWRHMNETCGLLKSSSSPNGSIQSQNIGMQDVAHVLWAELERADPLAIPLMMQETYEAAQRVATS